LGFNGYPKNICISINDEVVHGIPNSKRTIEAGDLVKLDLGILHNGYATDSAISIAVGKISIKEQKLIESTDIALKRVIGNVKAGDRLGKIGQIIEDTAREYGFTIVEDLTGHGIGKRLHEDPIVYNFGQESQGKVLKAGDTLAIEPMFSIGKPQIVISPDGWTIVTKDGSKASHFEHTVAITANGMVVLTQA
jgi:methionyl aminopeptidase